MKGIIFLCSILILASGSALAQRDNTDKPAGVSKRQTGKQAEAEPPTERARREADKTIGEAANPDRESGPAPDGDEAGREPGSRAADHVDHGNETSREMLQRRDESKAIKEEYKASGEKQRGKKPWHPTGRDHDDRAGDDDDADVRGKAGVGKSKSGKTGKSGRSDDQDHD